MRLKDEFITYETDGEQIMVAAGTDSFSGLVRSNETAGFIVECLKKTVTEDDIVHAMTDAYDASEAVVRRDVRGILKKLDLQKWEFYPQRMRYPSSLENADPEGYKQAVELLGGPDNIITPLWWTGR